MSDFARGARVRPKTTDDRPLSLIEASFVMVDVAKRDGLDKEQFLRLMTRAWEVHGITSVPTSEKQP